MTTKNRFAPFAFAAVIFVAGACAGCGQKKPQVAAADQQKIAALNLALKNGIVTQQEYDAKLKTINDLNALESACSSGVLTAQECATKRAALTSGNPNPADETYGASTAPSAAAPSAPNGSGAPDTSSGSSQGNPSSSDAAASQSASASAGAGDAYSDPQGSFTLTIPQGWKAVPQGQNGEHGVQITQGRSWALVAPFSNVNQPGDVVNNLAGQIQSQYKNFTLGQHGPMKLNGFDAAVAMFSGTNLQGVPVSLVIMGVAAPGGHMFAVMSSVPQGEEQNSNPALSSMVESLRFAGQ